jgi:60 kDa SS-A/Ro ribonucleoprotein
MANKSVFTSRRSNTIVSPYTAINEAGGKAYSTSDEAALAQYVCTGCLNQTFYASAEEQVDTILAKANGCSTNFLAKLAVYARKVSHMKDTPALLGAILSTRGEEGLAALKAIFNEIMDNQKQLRNFVQIIRSGRVGRKSMGTAVKRLVQDWLRAQSGDQLFYGSIGNDPSLADVVKMVHVKPINAEQKAFFGWLLGKDYAKRYLPGLVKAFEKFKADPTGEVPAVDFRMLTALDLSKEVWAEIAKHASWNTLRMNLNTFQRHGVFDDRELVEELAQRLANAETVRKSSAFPYQLLTTYQNVVGQVPVVLSNALQDAMKVATENVPELRGSVAVCVDVSGSMTSAVTGERKGATTKTRCVDVAGLVAASVLRKNNLAEIVPFDTSVHNVSLNPRDSVMTNARKLALNGGGTDCSIALAHLLVHDIRCNTVIYVSDNQSWYRNEAGSLYGSTTWAPGYGRGTTMAVAWAKYKAKNPRAKLVCIDLQPSSTVQVPDNNDVLNVGGFSDTVFTVVAEFINGDNRDFAKVINDASL